MRASSGKNTVHLSFEGDGAFLAVAAGRRAGARFDTTRPSCALSPGADPQAVLVAAAAAPARSRASRSWPPSLEEIFIETVGDDARGSAA